MNRITVAIMFVLIACCIAACSTDPDTEPRFRVRNERNTKVNMQVKTSNGNTININDVQGGITSAYQNTTAGTIVATATIQGESVSPTATFNASMNASYTIAVKNSTPPALEIVKD